MNALRKGQQKWRESNPQMMLAQAMKNLPKDCSGSKNGNWRGGKARARQEWRNKLGNKLTKFRKEIISRDKHICRDCGSQQQLEIHHIVPLSECREAAFSKMNAVTLCKQCHRKTRTYCGRGHGKTVQAGQTVAILRTIPEQWHQYDTAGDWSICGNVILCFVTDRFSDESALAILLHELVEAMLCKKAGISEGQICDFDQKYEAERQQGKHKEEDEPGDSEDAPYRLQHMAATHVERAVCHAINLSWLEHSQSVILSAEDRQKTESPVLSPAGLCPLPL
jgi:hypothetical protein